MIFTSCPYCDETQAFGWEAGMSNGWFPSKCHGCGKVMWVEATSFCGETVAHETFIAETMKPGDEAKVEKMRAEAKNQSMVIYESEGEGE